MPGSGETLNERNYQDFHVAARHILVGAEGANLATREGVAETPDRFAKAWRHWVSGYRRQPTEVLKVFKDGSEDYDEILAQCNIPVYSHCEHHLAPFFGVAHIGYIPGKKGIVGLSKLSRLVDIYARRLQVQERMTFQIAHAFHEIVEPKGVAVVVECRHLCMESRGLMQKGMVTRTHKMYGILLDPAPRQEFLQLVSLKSEDI